jgi:hypothetical protein
MVDEILVAERDAEHALRHHRRDAVFDRLRRPAIIEASRKSGDQVNRPIGRAE